MSDILKHRLEQWSPEPPVSVWQGLEEHLAKDELAPLGQKLAGFQPAPPSHIWQKVEDELTHTTPVIKMADRRVWLRYAAGIAAAILIAYFTYRPGAGPEQATVVQENAVLPTLSSPTQSEINREPVVATASRTPSVVNSNKKVLPLVPDEAASTVQTAVGPTNPLDDLVAVQIPYINEQELERYIVLETSNAAVKLPKKLYNYFRCNDVPDKLACAFRLHHLRMQAASPSLLATSDFAGLLEMVQNVK